MPKLIADVIEPGRLSTAEQPVLRIGDELELRPFRHDDVAAVVAAFATPDIQYFHFRRLDDEEAVQWIDERAAATGWAHAVGLHRVELQHSSKNAASARVAERAGFHREGVRREASLLVDGWHDTTGSGRRQQGAVRAPRHRSGVGSGDSAHQLRSRSLAMATIWISSVPA